MLPQKALQLLLPLPEDIHRLVSSLCAGLLECSLMTQNKVMNFSSGLLLRAVALFYFSLGLCSHLPMYLCSLYQNVVPAFPESTAGLTEMFKRGLLNE